MCLPFEDFQRAFERLFFLLEDTDDFDASKYDVNADGFEDFQRAFERLFFLLEDTDDFDASKYDVNADGFVDWREFFAVYRSRSISIRLTACEKIFLTMDNPESSTLAAIISSLVLGAILMSSSCFILSTVPDYMEFHSDGRKPTPLPVLVTIDNVCLALFVVEYVLRLVTCWGVRSEVIDRERFCELVVGFDPIELPSKPYRILEFFIRPSNLIDLAAILPGVVGLFLDIDGGGFVVLRLIRLTRIFRVFRNPAFAEPVAVMSRTVAQSVKALYVLLFQLLLGLTIFGSLMYLCEGQSVWSQEAQAYVRKTGTKWNETSQDWYNVEEITPFESIPHAFWWACVTIFTVGYGDDYPTTGAGYFVAVCTMLFGLLILALPVGVIGGNFEACWKDVQEEKRQDLDQRENHVQEITASWTRLDPPSMSKIMLIEVWNDRGEDAKGSKETKLSIAQLGKRPRNCFMGEARINLQLPDDRPIEVRETVTLEKNKDIVNRPVSGQVTIEYKWMPDDPPIAEEGSDDEQPSPGMIIQSIDTTADDFELKGKLSVTILSAKDLTNLEFTRTNSCSSPYCIMLVYPKSPDTEGSPIAPLAWRTRTIWNDLNPHWSAFREIPFTWTKPQQAPKPDRKDLMERAKAKNRRYEEILASECEDFKSTPKTPAAAPEGGRSELDVWLNDFGKELRQTRAELHMLSTRVKTLLPSQQPSIGDLRDAARADSS